MARKFDGVVVGSQITVRIGNPTHTFEIRNVAKATKTSVTDNKGTRWTLDGREYGSSAYSNDRAEPHHESHLAEIRGWNSALRRRRKIGRISSVPRSQWERLTDGELEKVCKILFGDDSTPEAGA